MANESVNGGTSIPVPELAGGRPVLGHLMEFIKDPVLTMGRGWREHGDLTRFRLGPRECVLFSGPDAHDVYFKASDQYLDARSVYRFTVPIFGKGVAYDVEPEIMSEQLGFLVPLLREAAMHRFAKIMCQEANQFADELGDEGVLDLPKAMNELTVRIASHCLIGEEVRAQVDEGFAEAYHDLENGINLLGFFLPKLPTKAHRKRDRARRRISRIFNRIMEGRRKSGANPDDFMQKLMHVRYKQGRALTDQEIAGILLTLLFAGQHTSAVLATWTGLELLNSPSHLQEVRSEMQQIYRDPDSIVGFETLKKQVILESVVRENERMHPPLILLIRKVLQPICYQNQEIRPGSLAMVSPAVSHRLAEFFDRPDEFLPERFLPPRNQHRQHHYALIGFGGGKHRCMGKHFAYLQLKAIWTVFINRFDFQTNGVPAPHYGSWVTGPELPCTLAYKRRSEPVIFP